MILTNLMQNLVAFLLMLIAYFPTSWAAHIDFSYGNLLFLPIGVSLFSYLCMGPRTLPGVLLANTVVGYFLWGNWFGNGFSGFFGHVVVGSVAPFLAILIVKSFQLDNFSENNTIKYGPCLLLIILTGFINTLGKFFSFSDVLDESIEPLAFLGSFFVGDVLGAIVVMFIFAPIISPLIAKNGLMNCWLSVR